ncbi:ABC transporter related [Alkaliphilus metalliredigens QYMF]|uniref:ABC transporter related n=1 Tax=Alkaliphilus metalliredigens (strain QYMF) TaxID=293826 RepID=A6TNQ3_ALKMQ|nr:metal ABC transporter ATP-binding protein [Alkaliphilus metalliredigens]ABR47821.1 ABC transporter related [Alkaliphilus metalliredigens QYMF]
MEKDYVVQVDNLTVSYYGNTALQNISFAVEPSQLVGIIGPNGAGKSTLIKAILGLMHIEKGNVKVFNQIIQKVNKRIAYVPQHNDIDLDFPVLVEEVVMMGRYPHLSWWQWPSKSDKQSVEKALAELGVEDLKKRQIGELSGGQRQRVFLARALVQDAELFFLDEPFSGIDVISENIIIKQLRNLKKQGKTIFVVHHDLSKAEAYFDQLILLNKNLVKYGDSKDVFKMGLLHKAYNGSIAMGRNEDQLMVVSQ